MDDPMSKKHYNRFVAILCKTGKAQPDLVEELIDFFKEDNPAFDPTRFREALRKCRR